MSTTEDTTTPDAVYARQRWIPVHVVEWVKSADKIMVEYGSVQGAIAYENRHQARWRARRLVRLIVELRIHDRWQLIEHTNRAPQGWIWSVEYLKEKPDGR